LYPIELLLAVKAESKAWRHEVSIAHYQMMRSMFTEAKALVDTRNRSNAIMDWQFRTDDARIKLKRHYSSISDWLTLRMITA